MTNTPLPQRKKNRLNHWDYSTKGSYHITICTHNHDPLLGKVVNEDKGTSGHLARVDLTDIGQCCLNALIMAEITYEDITVDRFVIMPNHIHVLVTIENDDKRKTVSNFVGYLKSHATRNVHKKYPSLTLWQKGFYDHIIRGDKDYDATWVYIDNNPAKWAEDRYYRE